MLRIFLEILSFGKEKSFDITTKTILNKNGIEGLKDIFWMGDSHG